MKGTPRLKHLNSTEDRGDPPLTICRPSTWKNLREEEITEGTGRPSSARQPTFSGPRLKGETCRHGFGTEISRGRPFHARGIGEGAGRSKGGMWGKEGERRSGRGGRKVTDC